MYSLGKLLGVIADSFMIEDDKMVLSVAFPAREINSYGKGVGGMFWPWNKSN